MYLRTTCPQFLQFGTISNEEPHYKIIQNLYKSQCIQSLRILSVPISLKVIKGIAVIIIESRTGDLEHFMLHQRITLNAHLPFAIVPLTEDALIEESIQTKSSFQIASKPVQRKIHPQSIKPSFLVSSIYTYNYAVKGQDSSFKEESHQFWELLYVDTGELSVEVDSVKHKLESQQIMVILPGQFHKKQIEQSKPTSFFSIKFDLSTFDDTAIATLKNRTIRCDQSIYSKMNQFIQTTHLIEIDNRPLTQDLLVLYLKELIVLMIQSNSTSEFDAITNPVQTKFESELISEIVNYIFQNICLSVSVEDICSHFGLSRSTLQLLFHKYLKAPPKRYINDVKMRHAQHIIVQENITITEIAARLGYSSVHYFSRKFKTTFGISPSEFALSVYKENYKHKNRKEIML